MRRSGDEAIEIRQAKSEDLAALILLYEQLEDRGANWATGQFTPEDVQLSGEMLARLADYPDYKVYVAQMGDKIVGTMALLVMDSVPNGIPSGFLENLVVDRASRRRGVGRELMQFAMDVCRSKGCFELSLSSRLENEDAHRFYEAVGLHKKGYTFAVKTKL